MASTELTVKITPNDNGNPPGKLADAELHFAGGPLDGLKLIGFSIWERRGGGGRNVTFPARQYSVNGERRSFAFLRSISDIAAQHHRRGHPRGVRRVRGTRLGQRVDRQSAGASIADAPVHRHQRQLETLARLAPHSYSSGSIPRPTSVSKVS